VRWAKFGNDCGWVPSNTVDVWVVNATDSPPNVNNYPTVFCKECCWGNPLGSSSPETWTDCWVTALAYPFDDPSTIEYMALSDQNQHNSANTRDLFSPTDGRGNTAALKSAEGYAVQRCTALGVGWYLPATHELLNMSSATFTPPNGVGYAGAGVIESGANWHVSSTDAASVHESLSCGTHYILVNGDGTIYNYAEYKSKFALRCAWRP
jgi:hypothetical protein